MLRAEGRRRWCGGCRRGHASDEHGGEAKSWPRRGSAPRGTNKNPDYPRAHGCAGCADARPDVLQTYNQDEGETLQLLAPIGRPHWDPAVVAKSVCMYVLRARLSAHWRQQSPDIAPIAFCYNLPCHARHDGNAISTSAASSMTLMAPPSLTLDPQFIFRVPPTLRTVHRRPFFLVALIRTERAQQCGQSSLVTA